MFNIASSKSSIIVNKFDLLKTWPNFSKLFAKNVCIVDWTRFCVEPAVLLVRSGSKLKVVDNYKNVFTGSTYIVSIVAIAKLSVSSDIILAFTFCCVALSTSSLNFSDT